MKTDYSHEMQYLVSMPVGTTTMSRPVLKAFLLGTGGWMFVGGYAYDICSKHIGAGVYKVWLEKQH